MKDHEFQQQLMAYLDGELNDKETERLMRHVAADPAARKELESMRRLHEAQRAMSLIEPTEQAWRAFERGLIGRLVYRPLHIGGMTAFLAGALLLVGFGLYELIPVLWGAEAMPAPLRIGIAAVLTGLIAMSVSVLIRRFVTLPRDRYTHEVDL